MLREFVRWLVIKFLRFAFRVEWGRNDDTENGG